MSQMSKEEFDLISFQKFKPEDPKKKEKSDTRRFWGVSVPCGAGCGLVAVALTGAPMAFFPAFVIAMILVQVCTEGTPVE